jgi:hypothetical protein
MAYDLVEQVNDVLEFLNLPYINNTTLDSREASIVTRRLVKKERELLSLGWTFNTHERVLTPDINGFIYVPNESILRFNDFYKSNRYRREGDRLYDKVSQSFSFTSEVRLRTIETMSNRDDMPYWFLDLLTIETAYSLRVLLGGNLQDNDLHLKEELQRAKAIAIQADIEEGGINTPNGRYNRTCANAIGNIRVRDGFYL